MLANWNANGVGNLLADVFANIAAAGVGLGPAFRNHRAGGVANVFGTLFANPIANVVAYGACAALRYNAASGVVHSALTALGNHFASRVANSSLTAFGYHLASRVGDGPAAWFADIAANVVADSPLTAFGHHLAGGVVHRLATAFGNHAANGIRNAFSYAASLVTYAVDFLGFAGWNPNFLANRAWWALYAFHVAAAWAIDAAAEASVPNPCAWCTYGTALDRTSHFFSYRIPVTAIDRNRAGVVNWGANLANNFTSPGFLMGNHNRVVDNAAVCLLHWCHDRVVDDLFTGLNHGLAHRVVDHFAVCLVYRRHDRVVDHFGVILVHWLVDGVVDDFAASLIHGLVDRVLNFFCAGLDHRAANAVGHLASFSRIYRPVDRVRPSLGLVDRFANYLVYRAVTGFRLHPSNVDHLFFGNRLILGPRALLGLLFINGPTNRFHDSVRGRATAISDYATAAFITNCAAVGGIGLARRECHECNQRSWQQEQPSHLPCSLKTCLSLLTGWCLVGHQFAHGVLSISPHATLTIPGHYK